MARGPLRYDARVNGASDRQAPPGEPAWAATLRAMHDEVDRGVSRAVQRVQRRSGRRIACRRGCAACCRVNTDIPVFPVELAGISRHCVEALRGALREEVRRRCAAHEPGAPCPFLVAGGCAVYPVRPTACRLLAVFGAPCAEGEDAWHARRADVLPPPAGLLERAYRIMLPFHGVTAAGDQDAWLARGLVDALARNLPRIDWRSLARLMGGAGARGGGGEP